MVLHLLFSFGVYFRLLFCIFLRLLTCCSSPLPKQSLGLACCPQPSCPGGYSDRVGVPAPGLRCSQGGASVGGHRHMATRLLLPGIKPALAKTGPDTSREPAQPTLGQTSGPVLVMANPLFSRLQNGPSQTFRLPLLPAQKGSLSRLHE